MIYLTKKDTEGAVLQHFNDLEIDGVGYELETPKVVWNKYTHQPQDYLTFVAQEAGTFKFSGSSSSNTLQYSLDGGKTWTTLEHDTNSPTVQSGDSIMWKASGLTIDSNFGIGRFISSNQFETEGNIMSLVYSDDFGGQTSFAGNYYVFCNLFGGCSGLTTAENLSLPAKVLTEGCYQYMFQGCTSLTTAPELPATTLSESCYNSMFYGCTSLATAPVLSVTTLSNYCYCDMFCGCSNLASVSSNYLPATNLARGCYESMFVDCTSLANAPTLPATTLANACYYYMFAGCTSLTTAPELPSTTLFEECYGGMFAYCTGLTAAPELPATTLSESCYNSMFYGCTSLTTAPVLSATTLVGHCYQMMFIDCTSLSSITCLATDISADDGTSEWLYNVAAQGTFVRPASMASTWPHNENGIPNGWTEVDA